MTVHANVPYMDMSSRFNAQAIDKLIAAAGQVITGGRYIGGCAVEAVEQWMAMVHGVGSDCAVGVANGTDALSLALIAAGVERGDRVIIPAVSFYATAGSVLRIGAQPVVVDVLPNRPLIDPKAVERALDKRVKAIMPVHLFGDSAPAISSDVPIVEDKAQMALSKQLTGDFAALSFYPTKILGALGDAGMVICHDSASADRIRMLASHGGQGHDLLHGHSGWNSRLDSIQAAFLLSQREGMDQRLERRRIIAQRYDDAFSDLSLERGQGDVSVYVIRTKHRDAVARRLQEKGIETQIYYRTPLGVFPGVIPFGPTPNAESFCSESLALPFHEGLQDEDVVSVIETLHLVLREFQ